MLLAAAALCPVFAATTTTLAAPPKADEPAFCLLAVGDQKLPEDLHYLRSSKEGIPVAVSSGRRSEPLPAPAAGEALVFGLKRADATTGESAFMPLCRIEWPGDGVTRALVLLAMDREKIRGVAVDDGERAFPRASLRVINLTGRSLLARWGGFQGELAPGPAAAKPFPRVATTTAGQPGRFQVGLGVRQPDGNAKVIFAGWTEAWPNARTLLLVTASEGEANPRYRTRWIVESLSEKKAE